MPFVANDLQRTFMIEVINVTHPGRASTLSEAEFNRQAHTYLLRIKAEIAPITALARKCLAMRGQEHKKVATTFILGFANLNKAATGWLSADCLQELVSPKVIFSDQWHKNLTTLATLDEGL